jgi:hypothetical protein
MLNALAYVGTERITSVKNLMSPEETGFNPTLNEPTQDLRPDGSTTLSITTLSITTLSITTPRIMEKSEAKHLWLC